MLSGKSVRIAAVSDVPGDHIAVIGFGTGEPALCRAQDTKAKINACNAMARASAAIAAEQRGFAVRMNSECLHGELGAVARTRSNALALLDKLGSEKNTMAKSPTVRISSAPSDERMRCFQQLPHF